MTVRAIAVALIIVHRIERPVDRQLGEIRSDPAKLGVDVGEQSPLQQRIVGEVDAGHDVAGVKGDLLGLGEIVVGIAIERHLADAAHRHEFLGDELGRIEEVKVEFELVLLLDDLQPQLPLRIVAALDRFEQVAAVEIGVLAGDLLRLVPHQRLHALDGLPVKLDEARLALGVDQPKGVNPEPFHHCKAARERPIAHHPHEHMGAFGRQ